MAKQKKAKISCDDCGSSIVNYTGKKIVQCCPFCGEPVLVSDTARPLLNDFDSLDNFNDEEYYEEFEESDE